MAGISSESFENEEGKRKTVLEEKSKEDLIKIVKKQLNMLQKARGKTDEVNEKYSALEEEKKLALDQQSSTIIKLQQQIEKLETDVSNLTLENKQTIEDQDHEIKLLEEKLKGIEAEKTAYFTCLNEKEERLQCLSMQLNTIKETCHCYQEELTKLQKTNQEIKTEITVLTEARNSALESLKVQSLLLDSKTKEFGDLINETDNFKKKYTICIEENCSLTSEIENLEAKMREIQAENSELLVQIENSKTNNDQIAENDCLQSEDNDFSFLISDNQKLQSDINTLKKENSALKEKIVSFERELTIDSVAEIVVTANEGQQCQEFLAIKKENHDLLKNLCDVESTNSKLRSTKEELEIENRSLLEKLENVETERLKTNIELDVSSKEKLQLKEEIKRLLSTLQDYSDLKAGYEHALLQGATTESLTSKQENTHNVIFGDIIDTTSSHTQTLSKEINKHLEEPKQYFGMDRVESISGLEFSLLGGGDIHEMFGNENNEYTALKFGESPLSDGIEVKEITEKSIRDQHCFETLTSDSTDLTSLYEELKIEKDALADEIGAIRGRFDEYATLLQETLSENESLKLKLESYENEKQKPNDDLKIMEFNFADISTNTALEIIEKDFHDKTIAEMEMQFKLSLEHLEVQNLNLNQTISLLQTERSENVGRISSLSNEIECLNSNIQDFTEKMKVLESSKENIQCHSTVLEKQNFELNEKLRNKYAELDDINFQLELLVISIKQGVRQKNPASPNKAEKELHENISFLKTLVDDLVILSNTNAIKTKAVKSDLEDLHAEKRALEEELFQMKELNQFLEDEARELRNEVEQLKNTQSSIENYYDKHRVKSPSELYSIEEIDEKSIFIDSSYENASSCKISSTMISELTADDDGNSKVLCSDIDDKSFEQNPLTKDSPQVSALENNMVPLQTNVDENLGNDVIDYKSLIEKLTMENSNLKSTLQDKSILVEKIHCEMDSLLEKLETLNMELQSKDDDLENSQSLVADLQKRILEFDSINYSKQNVLTHIKGILNELSVERDKLKSDISSLNTFSNETLGTMVHKVTDSVNQFRDQVQYWNNKYIHLEEIIDHIRLHLVRIIKDLELWSGTMKQIHNIEGNIVSTSTLNELVDSLKKTFHNLPPCHVFPENKCAGACCTVVNEIKQLGVTTQQLFCVMHDYLNDNSYHSVLKELDSYKTDIVPNLETTITTLQIKLHDYANKDSNENLRPFLEQNTEKSSEDSFNTDLRNQLTETEIKMNKFKQIAVKLKKDLMESKKQNSEVTIENDKYASQLSEVQEELEKISTERFHYVNNYQSLQNEYDKIQDQLEIQKEDTKKLEGDLSTTLFELNSLKEKFSDVEAQLVKANQIIDSNTLAKQEKEKNCVDLESKLIVLETKKQEMVQKIEELEASLKQKIENMNAYMVENNNLKEQLNHSLKEEKKKTLLDLEMADYERSILELNNTIHKKDEELGDLNLKLSSEIEKNQSLLEEIKSTETLKETEEKRANSLKEILEKTKYELVTVKESEKEMLSKVSSLQIQLEVLTQQEESCKLQLSETSAEVQHLKDMFKTSSENHQRIVRSLEAKLSNQKQEITCAHKEVENIKQEFENYKIRVHSVLKQQKSSAPTFIPIDDDLKDQLESMVDKLKMQVKDLSSKLKVMSMEYETLQDAHDTLLQRHNKVIEDKEKKDSEWHLRLEQINAEKTKLRAVQEEQSSQHLLQNEMLVSTYKKQIKIMSDEHKQTVNELQKQLESADLEISRLQRDQQKSHGLPPTPTVQDNSLSSFDIFSQERQEGEGSESIDESDTSIRQFSLATMPTSGFLPFEKLLQSPLESGTSENLIPYQDWERILADLNASNKKIEHLSEVLNDSESSNLRLSEQVRVLKEEVRRLERNKEREQHAENLEYLKNVFIKFATLSACSEKAMLIPVLTTMLKLSPDEQHQLKSIAGDIDPNDAASSGWGSYLHRWSGLA